MKQIYIAAPFFSPAHLARVEQVEQAISLTDGLTYYSPRKDGVLQNMTPEQRMQKAPQIFKLNVTRIIHSDAVLCILDDHDTGMYWETGFAYYHRRYHSPKFRVFAYTSEPNKKLNVMLRFSFDYHAKDQQELMAVLNAFAVDKDLAKAEPLSDVY